MDREVFWSRYDLVVGGIIALHSFHESDAQTAGEKWIFTVCFLAASPARIAKDVDIGRPEVEPVIDAVDTFTQRFAIFRASLGADGRSNLAHERNVPSRSETNRLGEDGRIARTSDSMQTFAPPVVFGHVQPWNGDRMILHLGDLLFQGHLADQCVNPALGIRRGNMSRNLRSKSQSEHCCDAQGK